MEESKWSKKEVRLILFAAAVAVACMFLLSNDHLILGWGKNSSAKIGTISSVERDVRQKSSNLFSWKNLKGPSPLHLGDSIFTGDQSQTEIILTSGDRIVLGPNSLVTFQGSNGQLELNLTYGNIISQSKPSGTLKIKQTEEPPPEVVEGIVWTQLPPEVLYQDDQVLDLSWTSATRPSAYQVEVARDENFKKTIIKFKTQKSTFSYSNFPRKGSFFTRINGLNAKGQRVLTSRSARTQISPQLRLPAAAEPELPAEPQAPTSPTLLQTPQLTANTWTPLVPQTKSIHLRWNPVPHAERYELEVSKNSKFQSPTTIETKDSFYKWRINGSAPVHFRIRAISTDPAFTSGEYSPVQTLRPRTSVAEFSYQDRFEIMAQNPDDVAPPIEVPLKIENQIVAESFKVTLSNTEDLSSATEFRIDGSHPQITIPEPGTFFFSIQSLGKNGQPLAPASPVRRLEYIFRVPLAQPQLIAPSEQMTFFYQDQKDSKIEFSWNPVRQADSYILQISQDPEFLKIIDAHVTSQTSFLFRPRTQGKFYWRVKATNSENRESSWSSVQDLSFFSGRIPAGR
jgi:hypothetical protein